jgi:two-component system CheB/CheR fusion protein
MDPLAPSHEGRRGASTSSGLHFPVVGIGASAGGLAAVTRVLEALPASPGMAFVVVLHLSPKHESSAAEILQRATRMKVTQVNGTTSIEADRVYVIPPTKALAMSDGHLSLAPLRREQGRHIVIDLFYRTLADAHRERAIAVVLSGTGADGSIGIGDVKERGGIVVAQSPGDAEFDSMPESAIGTGKVDLVLPAVDIGQKLMDLWRNMQRIELPVVPDGGIDVLPSTSPEMAELALRDIMGILLARTGHDFKHYKRATVLRRIERRLQVNALPHLSAYRVFLEQNVHETEALLADMLIGVTNFFRDRDAFEALERQVVPELFQEQFKGEQLRVWVPGCSSGEEAYSLLMLVSLEMATAANTRPIQFFATDIDAAAIGRGREGRYPESIVTDVPPPLLKRYLSAEGRDYRVEKALRERVLFAQHNILSDPPFSRLDLVSCRNLLIYLDREVQKEILQMFHFALRPGGFLFLGSSETADATSLFSPVDKKNRIYRANPTIRPVRGLPRFPLGSHHAVPAPVPVAGRPSAREATASVADLHHRLLQDYAPPSLIVKPDGEILHSSQAGQYLVFTSGVPSQHLPTVIRPELRPSVRTAMFQAQQSKATVQAPSARMQVDGDLVDVTLTVQPVQHADWASELLLIVFQESAVPAPDRSVQRVSGAQDPIVQQLEGELERREAQLQQVIGQYETSVEDLRASNEELQAINEELRSATEELETSKEELQSTNEELITVNLELKVKVEETAEINDDLKNFISSTEIATIFIERDMRIKRFTPAAASIFNIIANDVGRSLLDITHKLDYDALADDAADAFRTLRTVEREVGSSDGRWFLARLLPYRTAEDRIDGSVLTFVDITSRRHAERSVHIDQERMQLIAASMPDFAIMTLDAGGEVTSWSEGAQRLFGFTEADMLGKPIDVIFVPEDRAAGAPAAEMRQARERGRAIDERWHQRKDGSRIFVSGIMSPMRLGRVQGYAKIARDMTAQQEQELSNSQALSTAVRNAASAKEANQLKDEFLAVMSHELKHPLNLIQVNAQLLLASEEAARSPALTRIGQTIQNTVRSQARIIDDLLDISRSRTGKLELKPLPLYVADALRPSLVWAAQQAAMKGVELREDLAVEPLLVAADPVRLEQIAMNLLSNAIKFTQPSGRVSVRLFGQDDLAVLEVTDTGRGIPGDFLPQVFELFKQEQSVTGRNEGGLGIGLALVRDLVKLHGGDVRAESDGEGHGARFTVHLPLHQRAHFGVRDEMVSADIWQGLRVLYVDDTADTLESFAMLLEIQGAVVTTASSGEAALAATEQDTFDVIVSDVGMPGMDGHALMAELRRRPGTADTPAIALSGYGRPRDIEEALRAGFNSHLNKPVEMPRLTAWVASLGLPRRP